MQLHYISRQKGFFKKNKKKLPNCNNVTTNYSDPKLTWEHSLQKHNLYPWQSNQDYQYIDSAFKPTHAPKLNRRLNKHDIIYGTHMLWQ